MTTTEWVDGQVSAGMAEYDRLRASGEPPTGLTLPLRDLWCVYQAARAIKRPSRVERLRMRFGL